MAGAGALPSAVVTVVLCVLWHVWGLVAVVKCVPGDPELVVGVLSVVAVKIMFAVEAGVLVDDVDVDVEVVVVCGSLPTALSGSSSCSRGCVLRDSGNTKLVSQSTVPPSSLSTDEELGDEGTSGPCSGTR